MSGVLKHTLVVRNPDTLEVHAFLAGDKVPSWVTDELVHPDNFEGADDGDSEDKGYSGKTAEELQAEIDNRNDDREDDELIEVEGTGKGGNVLKGDLVAALEADDEAQSA